MTVLLFAGRDLGLYLQRRFSEMLDAISAYPPDQLLAQPLDDLVAYFVEKYTEEAPTLDLDSMYVEGPEEVQVTLGGDPRYNFPSHSGSRQVPGTRVRLVIPYSGNGDLTTLQASTHSFNPPRADVGPNSIAFTYEAPNHQAEDLRRKMGHDQAELVRHLEWTQTDVGRWNLKLPADIAGLLQRRKDQLLQGRNLVSQLGIPVRRREDAATYSVPVQRKRVLTKAPPKTSAAFAPEPAISDHDYKEALRVLESARNMIERSPSTFNKLDEEELRDLLLVNLNTQFEGQVGGELFNGSGKTDILIRVDDRNVFIGECKFWDGKQSVTDALDQLLRYVVWRDSKAALLLFIKRQDATVAIERAAEAVGEHSNCKKVVPSQRPLERRDYILRSRDDLNREIRLALLPYVIPEPPSSV